jgi:heterodisulfide reductase subunit A-like polyferredoxin
MTKYENHIYLIICEVTMDLCKETNFSTHSSYCSNMSACIKDGVLSDKQIRHICKIADVLGEVFYIDSRNAGIYMSDFFGLEKYKNFELVVRQQREYYSDFIKGF